MAEKFDDYEFDYKYTAELRPECFKHIHDPCYYPGLELALNIQEYHRIPDISDYVRSLRQKDASTIFTNYFDDICDANELAIGRG